MTGPLFPGNYSTVWIRGRFITMDGQAVRGKLSLFPTVTGGALVNRSAKLIMSSAVFSADTGNDGYVAVQVPATNDPDLTPINFTYSVTTPIGQMFSIVVPYDTTPLNSVGDPLHGQPVIELIDLVPVGSSGGVGQLLRGIGVQSMVDNGAGGLLITYSDGSTTTIAMPGTVQGPPGPAGPASTVPGPQGPPGDVSAGQLSAAVAAAKLADRPDLTSTGAAVGGLPAVTQVSGGMATAFATLPLVLNVRAFGAKGDGTTDDTTALRAAITAAGTQGCVYLPPGTYITQKLTIGSGVWLVGAGYEATILKLKAGANSHLVETTNFDTLIGTDTVTGPYNFGVIGMTIDGNQANNPTGGHGLAIYGYGYTVRDLRIREAKGWGIWTEWAQQSASPGNDSMESTMTDFKIHHCTGGGIYLKGPHDTHMHNWIIYYCGPDTDGSGSAAILVPVNNYANGSILANGHIWGAAFDYGIDINSTGIMVIDCQLESAYTAQLRLRGNNNIIRDTKVFSGGIYSATTKGIVIEGGVTQNWISGKGENLGGAAIDLTGSGGQNNINFYNVYFGGPTSATPLAGTVDSASAVIFHNIQDGAVTADSVISFPQKIKTPGATIGGPYASGVGINTGNNASNALTVTTGGDTKNGVVVYANSATQSGHLLRLQSSAFADLVRVDATGRMFMASAAAPGTPTGGAWVYVESGAFKVKGTTGTVFTTAQQAAVASPTADVTALKTAVDGLRAALQASGLLAP